MFRALTTVRPAVRSAIVAPRASAAVAVRSVSTHQPKQQAAAAPAVPAPELTEDEKEQREYKKARKVLLWGGVCLAACIHTAYKIKKEGEHLIEHPHYQPPYAFVKRNMETGAGWWPGRHCMFFEFNCFAQTYAEADRMLAELEKEKYKTTLPQKK